MQLFAEPAFHCTRCGSPIPPESSSPSPHESQSASPTPPESASCPACGYTLTGVRLYDPKHFVWLGLLFSAMVPLFMAGLNWGRLGRTRTKWLCLGSGLLGFGSLFGFLALHQDVVQRGGSLVFNLIVNLPLGFLLRDQQRSTYSEALRFGAQRATIVKGLLGGLAMVVCAAALPIGAFIAVSQIELRGGVELMKEGRYDQAAPRFKRSLDWNPEENGAMFNLALCHVFQERWDEGAAGFERYLKRDHNNPAALAFLAYVRHRQGRYAEADALAAKAKALDPQIMEKLFGPHHELLGPPRSARAGPPPTGGGRLPGTPGHPSRPTHVGTEATA